MYLTLATLTHIFIRSFGTHVNKKRVVKGEKVVLKDKDQVTFGSGQSTFTLVQLVVMVRTLLHAHLLIASFTLAEQAVVVRTYLHALITLFNCMRAYTHDIQLVVMAPTHL